ncbi:hypothetical protein J31TS6_40600 [Brevibacillus reuszeri]|uniref:sce7726 family protein n=1 Tax=Brevibacillus reuszeri TaxID=54915 RepID=UPI001B2A1A2A|nr:sce7726 family protein [Brevibacillus reuszeri]GIO08032.1 hypothetical protein J31TS6_40600 [Brevibacillus reuszeri]
MDKLNDADIRKVLYESFTTRDEFILDPTTIIVDELDVCFNSARVDIAVINGKLHGFEIKSERDNLERLPSQVECYNCLFDTMTLVLSEVHLSKARKIVPKWWGIECVVKKKTGVTLKKVRKNKVNPKVQALELTQLLWRQELFDLLEEHSITKGIKSKTRLELGKIASENICKDSIAIFVRKTLKNRKDWKALQLQQLCDDLQQLQPN